MQCAGRRKSRKELPLNRRSPQPGLQRRPSKRTCSRSCRPKPSQRNRQSLSRKTTLSESTNSDRCPAPSTSVREEAAAPAPSTAAPATAPRQSPSRLFEHVDVRYKGKIVLDTAVSPQSREQYRRLAASLHHAQAVSGIKVVMVTSALVGEGKTLTASNVAMTLSESYKKEVLLVDADFRRPSVHAVFGIPPYPGPGRVAHSGAEREDSCAAGFVGPWRLDGRASHIRPDCSAHLRSHAPARPGSPGDLRLDHSRYAASRAA
jgi:hypothetical protein